MTEQVGRVPIETGNAVKSKPRGTESESGVLAAGFICQHFIGGWYIDSRMWCSLPGKSVLCGLSLNMDALRMFDTSV